MPEGEQPKIKMQVPDKKTKQKIAQAKGIVVGSVGQMSSASGFAHGETVLFPLTKAGQAIGVGAGVTMTQPMFFSPLHTPQNWQIASKRREVYQWARFYYENEPKVAAGVDFYSQFPMNGFTLECHRRKILKYYERVVKKLKLMKWCRHISHERHLLGDVFVFLEIECPHCHGTTIDPET